MATPPGSRYRRRWDTALPPNVLGYCWWCRHELFKGTPWATVDTGPTGTQAVHGPTQACPRRPARNIRYV